MRVRYYTIAVIVFFWISVVSGITVHNQKTSKKNSIDTFHRGGIEYSALPQLCEALGYTFKLNPYTRQYLCSRRSGRATVTFVENNRFAISADSQVVQLPAPPAIFDGNGIACVPVIAIPELFSTKEEQIQLSADNSTLTVRAMDHSVSATVPPSRKGIRSIQCSVKQNGTLLTIELTDSLPLDFMYYHPSLILNFYGGFVDTNSIKIPHKTGIVNAVSSVQFKESAQISLTLSTPIEEPLFDYVQDTKTIMVSLRPQRRTSANLKTSSLSAAVRAKQGITVVLDPGHGGRDPGAIGYNDVKEKDVVLAIALYMRDVLKSKPGIKVLLTRDKDVFVPLSDRTRFANENKADLLISIHADAVPGNNKRKNSVKGYKIYFLSQAKNEEDKLVAMRENAVIELEEKPQNYSNLQNVLIDLAGNEFLRESQDLCILVDQKFTSSLMKKVEKLHLGVGQANFWVLNGAFMPSVLIETGFLSNPQESKLLADKAFQKSIASALCDAVIGFAQRYGAGL